MITWLVFFLDIFMIMIANLFFPHLSWVNLCRESSWWNYLYFFKVRSRGLQFGISFLYYDATSSNPSFMLNESYVSLQKCLFSTFVKSLPGLLSVFTDCLEMFLFYRKLRIYQKLICICFIFIIITALTHIGIWENMQ